MSNITAPYLAIVVFYHLALWVINAIMGANKLGSMSSPVPLWIWVIGFLIYLPVEFIIQRKLNKTQ